MEDEKNIIFERIVDLLTSVMQLEKTSDKIDHLIQAQELIFANDLLDNFMDEVIGFQNDRVFELRRFVVDFIEASCKRDNDNFGKLLVNLNYLLNDSVPAVSKKCIQTCNQLCRDFLGWVSRSRLDEQLQNAYETWMLIKHFIFDAFESTENDGVRTQCIKFMETVVVLQTPPEPSTVPDSLDLNFETLINCTVVKADNIEAEAEQVFEQLVQFYESPHISSVNLMALMQSLAAIAKKRTERFLEKVIASMRRLSNNLPPTLAKSQVSSVEKQLKLQMLMLLKHAHIIEKAKYQTPIVELLMELGANQAEISKCFQDARKRGMKVEPPDQIIDVKRIKLEPANGSFTVTEESSTPNSAFASSSNNAATKPSTSVASNNSSKSNTDSRPPVEASMLKVTRNDATQALSTTADFLQSKFNSVENVCDLVLVTLLSVPDNAPHHFEGAYKLIGEPGSPAYISAVCKQLSAQLTAAGLGKGVEEVVARFEPTLKKICSSDKELATLKQAIVKGVIHEARKLEQFKHANTPHVKPMSTGQSIPSTKSIKQLNFAEITKEPNEATKFQVVFDSLKRILENEDKQFFTTSQLQTRISIVAQLAVEFADKYPKALCMVRDYAFEDLRIRLDLLTMVMQKSYMLAQKCQNLQSYEQVLACVLHLFETQIDVKERDAYLPRLFMDLPYISDDSLQVLKRFILESRNSQSIVNAFNVLKHLIEKIGELRYKLLEFIMRLCVIEQPEVKRHANQTIKTFYETSDEKLKQPIEQFVLELLRKVLDPTAPSELSTTGEWDEETIKHCLMPYLNLLPANHQMIHNLAAVYVSTNANVKRVILRSLEVPVKGMGMSSPQLLLLVENCPKGAETLVTRIIHILTDKQPPSADLVARVRDLYQKRVPDVRFLIPVLNGLTKKEVIDALPKLIMLNPVVVKEVFNRLLGDAGTSGGQSPLSPSELLVALHNIDTTKCDMKTVIKATGLCFAEKNVYTAEVLTVVMHLLMDQNSIPTLLMRTVIQSLSLYPQLIGFVMHILRRLILKQVWKESKLWEGFIKCCQRTQPQSFQVLLQLPANQLRNVFIASSDFKPALQEYVQTLTDNQRSHIPQPILDAIFPESAEKLELEQGAAAEPNTEVDGLETKKEAVEADAD